MNSLPDIQVNGHEVKERGQDYFIWLQKVKDVLSDDPTFEEIAKIRKDVKRQSIRYKNKVGEIEAYMKSHTHKGDNTENEQALVRDYSKMQVDLEYLYDYIGKLRPSHLSQQKTSLFERLFSLS